MRHLLIGLLALFATAAHAADIIKPYDGEQLPPFALKDTKGETHDLADLRGQVVVVNFWASWCPPCVEEMPSLERLQDRMEGKPFKLLAVNMGEDEDRVRPFIEEMGYTYPILLNPPQEMTREHNVRGLPVSFIVGPDGDIVYRRVGEILPEEFDLWLEENVVQ